MTPALRILLGAGMTVFTATAIGTLLLRGLGVKLYRLEEYLLGFVTGSACLSAIMFVLCAVHMARTPVFLAIAALALAATLRFGTYKAAAVTLPDIPKLWKWIFGAVFTVFAVLYFFNAMAPERSPDGMAYHLPLAIAYYRAHGFVRITANIYANISQGVELLFLFAYAFGRHSAAALVHFSFLATLPWMMLCYARRFGIAIAGAAAAMFVFASPIVGVDGVSAYVDVALAAVLFALFYFLQIWIAAKDNRLLVPIGILAGFSFAIKYTAILVLPYALVLVAYTLWRARRPMLRPAMAVSGIALLFILPWLIKNWMWVGNPVTPFANRLFPNPYVHVHFEDDYRRYMATYDLTSYRQLPYELTIRGGLLCGLLGPLFLLAPISLLALRSRQGRQLLLAAAVFGATYFSNLGTRFLIPVLPFVSLALALALARLPILLAALTLAHAVASWPPVVEHYRSPAAWRLEPGIPVKAALRIEPEDSYLRRKFSGYVLNRMLEQNVPAGAKVFSTFQICEAYTTREIAVKFLAAPNELLNDSLLTPLYREMQPDRIIAFQFPERTARRIRVVNTARSEALWSIAELRVYDSGKELPRAPQWRLSAQPNAWDVQLAFDNDSVTRWRSWQPAAPGMHLDVDFGGAQKLDTVAIETSFDSGNLNVRLEAEDAAGKWTLLSGQPTESENPITVSLRRAATGQLKFHGFRYLLVGDRDLGAEDFHRHRPAWGIRLIGEEASSSLYYIE